MLRNDRPLAAADLGALLTSLSDDYRKLTRGRTLVVSRLYEGSLFAHLKDVAEGASSIKDIIELGKLLFDLLKEGFSTDRTKLFQGRRSRGVRSAERIVQLALDADATIEVHIHADGEITDLKITPLQAARIAEEPQGRIVGAQAPPTSAASR